MGHPPLLPLILFVLTYAGLALGRVPGLAAGDRLRHGTFAGNAVLVGSIANLIVAEQAARLGVPFGFREHLRVGLPVTLISLALAAGAMLLWRL